MPRNGSGTYSLPAGNPVVTGTTISSTTQNTTMSDVATALTNSIAKDGQTTPTANLPMGGFKHTGLGAGSAATDSANLGQIQSQAYIALASVAGTDTITASTSPVTTAYANGQTYRFVAANTNTGAVTVNINGLGAKAITKNGATALAAGDIVANTAYSIYYDGTQFQLTNARFTGGAISSTMIWKKGADVASATALPLITDGNYFDVTGTTTITSFDSIGVGTWIGLQFDGALTLTHNSTDLILPGGANIITAAGDEAIFVEYASGDWRCVSYTRATTSRIRLDTANGYGSTNTVIKRYTTVTESVGGDITYTDSAANGASFTINASGVYAITMRAQSAGTIVTGVSVNSASLTTAITSLTGDQVLTSSSSPAANTGSCSVTAFLDAGDVVRPHTTGAASSSNASESFIIVRVS
jgi:hypothetical protein